MAFSSRFTNGSLKSHKRNIKLISVIKLGTAEKREMFYAEDAIRGS